MKEVVFGFLAAGVEALADGQVIIIRPDMDGLMVSQIPIQGRFVFVAKLSFRAEELSQAHAVRVECTKPDGSRTVIGGSGLTLLPNPQNPAEDSKTMTIGVIDIKIEAAGLYQFHLLVDNNDVMTKPLTVLQLPQVTPVATMGPRP